MMNGTPERWHKQASPEGHPALLNKRSAALQGESPDPQAATARGTEAPPYLGVG